MQDRRLAAIMFTDIVGYTALMGKDEDQAFKVLKINREIHALQFARYNGTLIKEIGDGILASFPSAYKAVQCAKAIQEEAKLENISLRIGIHEGEVVFEGSDVLGDGVNVASRLEELAQEGCIYISGAVYKDIKNKAGIKTEFIEERTLKNVDEPVKIYKVEYEERYKKPTSGIEIKETKRNKKLSYYIIGGILVVIIATILIWYYLPKSQTVPLATEDKTDKEISIAVLPFDNLSGDPEQEFMCDGLTEEIIHHLSKIEEFDKIISRNSVMTFKNSDRTTPEIAEQLNVNTILEGSYRQAGNMIRITTQLIDATSDDHLWSESYDRPMGDIFVIQSDIAKNIASALQIRLSEKEVSNIEKKPTTSTEAYNLLKKGEYLFMNYGDFDGAIELSKQALEIDPNYSDAYACIGTFYLMKGSYSGNMSMQSVSKLALPYIEKALELNLESALAHFALASLKHWSEWDFIEAEKEFKYALNIESMSYANLVGYSDFLNQMGRYEESLKFDEKLFNSDPLNWYSYRSLSGTYYRLNQKEKAFKILKEGNDLLGERLYSATGRYYVMEGKYNEAIYYFEKFNQWRTGLGNPPQPRVLAWLGLAYYNNGEYQKADSIENELKLMATQSQAGSPNYFIAMYYSGIGDKEMAFYWLEKAYKSHSVELINLKIQPQFDSLRDDPRYWDLYEKVGFKAYDEYLASKSDSKYKL